MTAGWRRQGHLKKRGCRCIPGTYGVRSMCTVVYVLWGPAPRHGNTYRTRKEWTGVGCGGGNGNGRPATGSLSRQRARTPDACVLSVSVSVSVRNVQTSGRRTATPFSESLAQHRGDGRGLGGPRPSQGRVSAWLRNVPRPRGVGGLFVPRPQFLAQRDLDLGASQPSQPEPRPMQRDATGGLDKSGN